MTGPVYHRGDVHWGNLDPQKGAEQAGRRPVLIFQVDRINRAANTIVVIPFTSQTRWASLPTCVLVPRGAGGLMSDSVALCHQILAIDKAGGLGARMGTLPPIHLKRIEDTVRRTLGLM